MAEHRLPGGARFDYTDHLVDLVARCARLAGYLDTADARSVGEAAAAARSQWARLSARLDGSPLPDETADAVDRGAVPADLPRRQQPEAIGWARTLKLDGVPTQDLAAVEYANLLACWDAEPALAERFLEAPLAVLTDLHGLVCRGLVDAESIGRPRRTDLAVHDGAQGKMLYTSPDPVAVPRLLEGLVEWIGHESAGMPDLVVAGVVHERLLEWQPFEAGNGRLARAASRVLLRARGLDRRGLAVPEATWVRDPLAYYGEVAATIRRRGDLGPWLQWWAEALVEALDTAGRTVGARPERSPRPVAAEAVRDLPPGETVTVADLAARAGIGPDSALQDLRALVDAGWLRLEPGTRGLRYRRLGRP